MSTIPISDVQAWLSSFMTPEELAVPLYKRPPYKKHKDHITELTPVFQALMGDLPYRGLTALSKVTGISTSTLGTWKAHLATNPDWRPSRAAYADHRRIFTDNEEAKLILWVTHTYLESGLYYTDSDFQLDCRMFYNLLDQDESGELADEDIIRPRFQASRQFVQDFRHRHRMALRRPSMKRRRTVSKEELEAFVERARHVMEQYPANRVINVDETNWRAMAPGFLTWAKIGSESVTCQAGNDEKEGVTVIADCYDMDWSQDWEEELAAGGEMGGDDAEYRP
jgi:hypothetical protein